MLPSRSEVLDRLENPEREFERPSLRVNYLGLDGI